MTNFNGQVGRGKARWRSVFFLGWTTTCKTRLLILKNQFMDCINTFQKLSFGTYIYQFAEYFPILKICCRKLVFKRGYKQNCLQKNQKEKRAWTMYIVYSILQLFKAFHFCLVYLQISYNSLLSFPLLPIPSKPL